MATGFERLLKVFISKGIQVPPEDVADALWLSTRLFDGIEVERQQVTDSESEPNTRSELGDIFDFKQNASPERENVDEIRTFESVNVEAPLHGLGDGSKGKKIRGHSIRLPSAPTLPQMLEMERALRPLARRKLSKYRWELDEKATADFIATSDMWNIIQRPAAERWLEGVIVVEQSPTMRLWQETVQEFRQLLWRVGAFQWMETVHLDAFNSTPRLTSPINAAMTRHPLSICRPDASRVIFFCTDNLSNAWLSGKIPEWVALWGKYHSVVILQMLPDYMWRRTSLRRADFVTGTANTPISTPRAYNSESSFSNTIHPVPVVSLQPESLRDLSNFLTASPGNQISCYWNLPEKFHETTAVNSQSPSQKFEPNAEFAIKSFEKFKETVSPITLDLARYLSIVPLFLPIMRLIQHAFVPKSQPAHLAELFNSGILYRISPSLLGEHPNQIEYDFLLGVRETLLNQRSRPLISDVWKVLSDYIDDRFGRGKEFLSIIFDPSSTEEYVSGIKDEAQLPFARIGAIVLRRLGGEYSHAAEHLEKVIQDRLDIPNSKQKMEGTLNNLLREDIKPETHSRLARHGIKSIKYAISIEDLLAHLPEKYTDADRELVQRAYRVAEQAHREQTRLSGEPYITHCIAVAKILSDLVMPPEVVAAGLLHDTVEDTLITLDDLSRDFGDTVKSLVDGVTTLTHLPRVSRNDQHAEDSDRSKQDLEKNKNEPPLLGRKEDIVSETLRMTFIAMGKDVRVMFIKLADRLHNMRTLGYMPEHNRKRISKETLEIFAPVANRLGIWQIKWELEDLAFSYTNPEKYKEIADLLTEKRIERDAQMEDIKVHLAQILEKHNIKFQISGRPKHIYSIYRKMQKKGKSFDMVWDVRAVRLIVADIPSCYTALGVIHATWSPFPHEFDDYIAAPKNNFYQSLHTTIFYEDRHPLEIQILTPEMHMSSEYGVAIHWGYKEGTKGNDKNYETFISSLRSMVETESEARNASEFVESMRSDVFQDRVYIFTPQGDIIDLPVNSTPIDFAYHVHTDIGHNCRGARVNGKLVALDHKLKTGDQVEIILAPKREGTPSRDWLNPSLGFIQTQRARTKIEMWFKKQDNNLASEQGQDTEIEPQVKTDNEKNSE